MVVVESATGSLGQHNLFEVLDSSQCTSRVFYIIHYINPIYEIEIFIYLNISDFYDTISLTESLRYDWVFEHGDFKTRFRFTKEKQFWAILVPIQEK